MPTQVPFDDAAACDHCGRFGAFIFDEEKLCPECYNASGACCAEFGGNDLTACEEALPEKNPKK